MVRVFLRNIVLSDLFAYRVNEIVKNSTILAYKWLVNRLK